MKKLLTLVVILLSASFLFAQSISQRELTPEMKKEALKQMATKVKSGDIMSSRGMNDLLYNKKKELGKLKTNQVQVPHGEEENDVVVYEQDFELTDADTYLNLGSSSGGNVESTTFNSPGTVGNLVWWFGTNDPSFEQPGYGAGWGVFLQHSNLDYQLQNSLTSAAIEFDGFYNIEQGWDGVHLQVSTDGGVTWDWVACWSGDTGGQWANNIRVDVSDYIGEYITFRFVLISDGAFDSEDGEVGSFENPGGFFIEDLYVVRNGVKELVSDGGDTKFNMFSGAWAPAFLWSWTDEESASPDMSMGYAVDEQYDPGSAYFAAVDMDLSVATTLGGNPYAPLWLDFNVYSTMPGSQPDGAFDYWAPYLVDWSGPSLYALSASVYVGPFGDGGDFVAYSDNFGYIDISDFIDNPDVSVGILFASNGGCSFGDGEFYFDDVTVTQKNDPYEYNDECDTATIAEYGFVTEFATIWNSTGDDVDYFYFTGEAGDWVDVYVDNSSTDLEVALLPNVGSYTCGAPMVAGPDCCELYSYHDGAFYDRIIWKLPYTGGYFVEVANFFNGEEGGYVLYIDELSATSEITSITDVPNDQGKNVLVKFTAPELDVTDDADFSYWGATVDLFQIERRVNVISNDWVTVTEFDATGKAGESYLFNAATVVDSANAIFRVRTKGGTDERQGRFVTVGAQATGQSYDNIAPVFNIEYTAAPQSGSGIDVGAEVDYGGGNNGVSDIMFYNIYRGTQAGFTPSASNLIATYETHATTVRFNDAEYDGNTAYYYIIQVVDNGGNKVFSKEVNTTTDITDEAVPTVYSLSQNYPNPFNPSTTIKFGIPQAADVTVKIYDILGQEVKTLMNRNLAAGFHTVNFDASNLISGMYIYRIQANGVDGSNFTDVKKMLLVK